MTRLVFFEFGPSVPSMVGTMVQDCGEMSEAQIDLEAYSLAIDQCESYGEFIPSYDERLDNPDDEDLGHYFTEDDLTYRWEDYDPAKHDMYRCGGGSFLEDFEK